MVAWSLVEGDIKGSTRPRELGDPSIGDPSVLPKGTHRAILDLLDYYRWDPEKNERLKAERGIGFERVLMHIERGDVVGIYDHSNPVKYPKQRLLVVNIDGYAYLVPFVDSWEGRFLKTIIPSRKATRDLLGGSDEKD